MQLVLQVIGSLLVLAAYVLAQFKVISSTTLRYLVLNVIGSGILGVLAIVTAQWGFALLECVWSVVSLVGVITQLRLRAQTEH